MNSSSGTAPNRACPSPARDDAMHRSMFATAALIGYHAAEGSSPGVLAHTFTGKVSVALKGTGVPEAGISAAIACFTHESGPLSEAGPPWAVKLTYNAHPASMLADQTKLKRAGRRLHGQVDSELTTIKKTTRKRAQ